MLLHDALRRGQDVLRHHRELHGIPSDGLVLRGRQCELDHAVRATALAEEQDRLAGVRRFARFGPGGLALVRDAEQRLVVGDALAYAGHEVGVPGSTPRARLSAQRGSAAACGTTTPLGVTAAASAASVAWNGGAGATSSRSAATQRPSNAVPISASSSPRARSGGQACR